MRVQRLGTFTGGIVLPEEKSATRKSPLQSIATPPRLAVSLDPCARRGARAAVQVGQRVRRGDLLGGADGLPVFAPLDGRVATLNDGSTDPSARSWGQPADGSLFPEPGSQFPVPCSLFHRHCAACHVSSGPAVELVDLSAPCGWTRATQVYEWREADAESLRERIAAGGLTTMRQPIQPLADWCARARQAEVDTLIACGVENQPYLTGEYRLLVEQGPVIIRGLAILAACLGSRRVMLAVDHRSTGDYQHIIRPASHFGIQPVALPHKYPIGHDVILTHVLTGRETPAGDDTMAVGVAVIGVSELLAIYHWVACGIPPTERAITVSGDGWGKPGNYIVPFGTPVSHILEAAEAPATYETLCQGGPMASQAITPQAIVGPTSTAILALGSRNRQPASACVRCSWCTDHCPVRLNVASLNDQFELGQLDRAVRYGVAACIGCGVCSYICPARLPLAHRMKTLKCAAHRAGLMSVAPLSL